MMADVPLLVLASKSKQPEQAMECKPVSSIPHVCYSGCLPALTVLNDDCYLQCEIK